MRTIGHDCTCRSKKSHTEFYPQKVFSGGLRSLSFKDVLASYFPGWGDESGRKMVYIV